MILTTTDCSVNVCNLFENFESSRENVTELSLKYSSDCCGENWIERKKYYSDVTINFENSETFNCSQGEGCLGLYFNLRYIINGSSTTNVDYVLQFNSDDTNIEANSVESGTLTNNDFIPVEKCASGKFILTLIYTQNSRQFTTIVKFNTTGTLFCAPQIPTNYTITQTTPDDGFTINEEGCIDSGIVANTNNVWNFLLTIKTQNGESISTYTETRCIFLDCTFGCSVAKYVNENFEDDRTLGIASMYYLIFSAVACGDCCTACNLFHKTNSLIGNECNC